MEDFLESEKFIRTAQFVLVTAALAFLLSIAGFFKKKEPLYDIKVSCEYRNGLNMIFDATCHKTGLGIVKNYRGVPELLALPSGDCGGFLVAYNVESFKILSKQLKND